jgi:hypothetical protein
MCVCVCGNGRCTGGVYECVIVCVGMGGAWGRSVNVRWWVIVVC